MSQIATRHGCGLRSLNLPPRVFYDGIHALDLKINYTMSSVIEDSAQKLPVEQKTYQLNEKQISCVEQNTNRAHTNHVTFQRTFKVVYLGYAVLDRRYTLPMLPWVIAEIKRHGSQNEEEIYIEVTEQSLKAASCESNALVFEHKLQTISKFAQSSHDPSCFTYMTREVQNGPCAYHVFQANDEN
ncbi:TBC1 domain family member 4, partial [Stegodyphus mimosarum]